jgi:hypothetical protein
MTTILTVIGLIVLVCCFGACAKIAGIVLHVIGTLFGWAFDGCISMIIIVIILMFIVGAFII